MGGGEGSGGSYKQVKVRGVCVCAGWCVLETLYPVCGMGLCGGKVHVWGVFMCTTVYNPVMKNKG